MKLSEAIRLGAMLGPQLRGFIGHVRTCDSDSDGDMCELIPELGTCAQGAALVAIAARWSTAEARLHAASLIELCRHWPWLSRIYHCPECPDLNKGPSLLSHLNDCHKWTRERIAGHIATIEPEEPEDDPSQPPPVERLKSESKPEVMCGA